VCVHWGLKSGHATHMLRKKPITEKGKELGGEWRANLLEGSHFLNTQRGWGVRHTKNRRTNGGGKGLEGGDGWGEMGTVK